MICHLGMIASLPYTLTTYDTAEVVYRPGGDKWEEFEFDDVGYSDDDFDAE